MASRRKTKRLYGVPYHCAVRLSRPPGTNADDGCPTPCYGSVRRPFHRSFELQPLPAGSAALVVSATVREKDREREKHVHRSTNSLTITCPAISMIDLLSDTIHITSGQPLDSAGVSREGAVWTLWLKCGRSGHDYEP